MRFLIFLSFFFLVTISAMGQENIPLYSGEIPNHRNVPDSEFQRDNGRLVYKVSSPTLTVFQPEVEKNNGIAMIVCPGGGYLTEAIVKEGMEVAQRLKESGITAFVLKYRLPSDITMKDKSIGPLQDAQHAIYKVRKQAARWNINPAKIGIMGFSAGGHLASTAGTHFTKPVIKNGKVSVRPDFMALIYPVISMKKGITHAGSRENLLGKDPSKAQVTLFSNDLQVDSLTPPTFIAVAEDDKTVPIENSLLFFKAMREKNRSVSLHVYHRGGHGFNGFPPRDDWMSSLIFWVKDIMK